MEPKPKPNRGKDYWIVVHIISLVSTSGPESEKKCLLLKSALFNNISIGRVGEDKSELKLNVNSINFQVFCCQRLSWKEIQLQRQPQTNEECHLCQHGHVYYV
ncbi:hypothetical protein CsSME_00043394 [Camellia sinensis var. sinensis]